MKKLPLTFNALTALAFLFSACNKKSADDAGKSPGAEKPSENGGAAVVLALDWVPEPEFGGFYAARESGAFRRNGLTVEIRGGGAGVPVVQMVATGKAQFGIAGAAEVITARARGADVVPIFATFQTSPQGIMVHASRGYKTLGEALKTGTLALEPGHPYAVFLKKKYGSFGATVVPYDGGVARFMVDRTFAQQCFVTAEPFAAKRKGGDPQVFLVADEGFNPYTAVVIVARSVLKEHPEWVRGFVLAAREGWASYLAAPAATNAVMQKLNPSMDAETFAGAADAEKALIETEHTKSRGIGSMERERWETLGKQLVDLKLVEREPPPDDYLVPLP
jgi:NitT/TauT family transport system substrate-binding protein